MAAIGKIRSWGPVLVGVIGLALFAFIAEELFRSCDSMKNQERQQVGEVLGKKIDYQEYQKLYEEYQDVIKMSQGRENLTDEEMNQVKDMVWNQFVQNTIIQNEAEQLGLTVTDEEMQNILNEGTNPMLMQTPFVNQQTGRFDVTQLRKFIADYKSASSQNPQLAEQYRSMYNYWTFVEKNLRQQTLAQKYQALLNACMLSNPVSAKALYDAQNQESSIELASYAYNSIKDDKIEVTDQDLKAKYDELRPRFRQLTESRDIKYVDLQVKASAADRAKLDKEIAAFRQQLTDAADPTDIVRKSGSLVPWLGVPVTKNAFPRDIQKRIDSLAVGATSAPEVNEQDNTINVVRLISKQQLPDSIEFRMIQVAEADVNATRKKADSIYNALQGGADFEAIAKKYGQTGAKNWMTTSQYQGAPSMDKDTRNYIETLNTAEVGALKNLSFTSASVILQVTSRRAMTDKYVAAVIKKSIDFSNETYNSAYNRFSQFVSESQTFDALEKNAAKYGYKVEELKSVSNSDHYIASIHSTHDALKWLFEAKKGDISPLYECGDNDHLLVLVCDGVNKEGFLPYDNEQVKNYLRDEVIKDKKAEQIINKVKGVKDMSSAKAQGGVLSNVDHITFDAPVFVQSTGASEPALSGAVAATKVRTLSKSPVKGNAGVYIFLVKSKEARKDVKFDEKKYEQQARQTVTRRAGNFMQQLYQNAGVKDNRYLFF